MEPMANRVQVKSNGMGRSAIKNGVPWAVFMAVMMICTSCEDFFEKEIDVVLPEAEEVIALHAFFNTGENRNMKILVSKTRPVLEEELPSDFLNEAVVKLKTEEGSIEVFPHPITDQNRGQAYNFETESLFIDSGKEFEMTIEYPGLPTVKARQKMPERIVPDSVIFVPHAGLSAEGNQTSALDIYFQDPPGEENYYQVLVSRKFEPEGPASRIYIQSIDPATSQYEQSILVRDLTFDGTYKRLRVFIEHWYWQNPQVELIELEWRSISREYYLYGRSYERYFNSVDNPFVTPAQLYTNVENGVGIFSVGHSVFPQPR